MTSECCRIGVKKLVVVVAAICKNKTRENPRFESLLPFPPVLSGPLLGEKKVSTRGAESRRIRRARFMPPPPLLSFRLRADEGRKAPSTGESGLFYFPSSLHLFAVLFSTSFFKHKIHMHLTASLLLLSVAGIFFK